MGQTNCCYPIIIKYKFNVFMAIRIIKQKSTYPNKVLSLPHLSLSIFQISWSTSFKSAKKALMLFGSNKKTTIFAVRKNY